MIGLPAILTTDNIPTYGLTFSQIDIRLCPAQEGEVPITIPCKVLCENADRYIEHARQGGIPEVPDGKGKALDKLCEALSKFPTHQILGKEVARLSELDSKSKVNLHIVGKFLKALTDDDGQCVVNASHEKDLEMIAVN